MTLVDTIFIRKSTRAFLPEELPQEALAEILRFTESIQPLDSSLPTKLHLASRDEVIRLMPWASPHYVCLCSPSTPQGLMELGFRYQQLDLYLQSRELGACWLGLARPKAAPDENLDCQVLLAFGQPKGTPHRPKGKFQRKTLDEIVEPLDTRFEVARIAPSATNRQPWLFIKSGEDWHVYGQKGGYYRMWGTSKWLWIDLGIALSHMMLTSPNFSHHWLSSPPKKAGYVYAGTIGL